MKQTELSGGDSFAASACSVTPDKNRDNEAEEPEARSGVGGFIEFDLCIGPPRNKTRYQNVVCFASQQFAPCAVEITGDKMPQTWLEGYEWEDLNILYEAYHSYHRGRDLRSLMSFIRAFGFPSGSKMYMHIWRERLPGGGGAEHGGESAAKQGGSCSQSE